MNTDQRPTPETDAASFWGRDMGADNGPPHFQCVDAEFASRLERQRDEARDRIAELEKQLEDSREMKVLETFEAHGLTWIKHTPGDPMPCEAKSIVRALTRGAAQNKYIYRGLSARVVGTGLTNGRTIAKSPVGTTQTRREFTQHPATTDDQPLPRPPADE